MSTGDKVLISVAELEGRLQDHDPPRLLDVRWKLGGPPGADAFRTGHIPGAVYVDLDSELAAPPGPGVGRHPLPDPAALQSAARSWGCGPVRRWSPMTTSATSQRPAPGGCCGGPD